jgi:Bacterial PH domain
MRARISVAVVVAYGIMILLLIWVVGPRAESSYGWALYFLLAVSLLFLARYLSTRYWMDERSLVAWRLFGTRRVPLSEVRGIEYASLRDLATVGGAFGMGSLGWRGRMYSTLIGEFDSVYTDAANGLLVTAGAYPLYISPLHRDAFARELSRRARSYSVALLRDVGNPSGPRVSATAEPPHMRDL